MTNSIIMSPTFVLMLILVALIATATSTKAESSADTKPAPSSQLDLGSFIMEMYENTTNYQDKLRYSKSTYKVIIKNKFSPNSPPLYTLKATHLSELVRCDNLTLDEADMEPLFIDCRPLQTYVLDGIQVPIDSSNRHTMFAYRDSFRLKRSPAWSRDARQPTPFSSFGYYLRDEVSRSKVEAFVKGDAKFKEQEFFGLYMEHMQGPVKCSMNVFGSINTTGLSPPVETKNGMVSFFEYASNGISFGIENIKCVDSESSLPITLYGDFKLIYQQEFPFLQVNHRMFTHPLRGLFEFQSLVTQTRDEFNLNKYNTSIEIKSKSDMANFLNFNLEQLFVNEDSNTNWEKMVLIHPNLVISVDADRKLDSFIKSLLIFLPKNNQLVGEKPIITLIFHDRFNQDEVGLDLRVKRDFLESLFAGSQAEQQPEAQHQHQEL